MALHPICSFVPQLISDFVDSFVDYHVGGQILPCMTKFPTLTKDEVKRSPPIDRYSEPNIRTSLPPVERLIAIGDFHGDFEKAKDSLVLAKVMNRDTQDWIGKKTTVVQVGDIFDRGGGELKILYLLEKLKAQARREGGDVIALVGNHEVSNIRGRFHYVNEGGVKEFLNWKKWYSIGQAYKKRCEGVKYDRPQEDLDNIEKLPPSLKARLEALRPGGPITSRFISNYPVGLMVASTVFAHAGVLNSDISDLRRINRVSSEWMKGERKFPNVLLPTGESITFTRKYDTLGEGPECDIVDNLRDNKIPEMARVVVGHSVQRRGEIVHHCKHSVWLIDVGMSSGVRNNAARVLKIKGDRSLCALRHHQNKIFFAPDMDYQNVPLELDESNAPKDFSGIPRKPRTKKPAGPRSPDEKVELPPPYRRPGDNVALPQITRLRVIGPRRPDEKVELPPPNRRPDDNVDLSPPKKRRKRESLDSDLGSYWQAISTTSEESTTSTTQPERSTRSTTQTGTRSTRSQTNPPKSP